MRNILDDSLSVDRERDGVLTEAMKHRIRTLAEYGAATVPTRSCLPAPRSGKRLRLRRMQCRSQRGPCWRYACLEGGGWRRARSAGRRGRTAPCRLRRGSAGAFPTARAASAVAAVLDRPVLITPASAAAKLKGITATPEFRRRSSPAHYAPI